MRSRRSPSGAPRSGERRTERIVLVDGREVVAGPSSVLCRIEFITGRSLFFWLKPGRKRRVNPRGDGEVRFRPISLPAAGAGRSEGVEGRMTASWASLPPSSMSMTRSLVIGRLVGEGHARIEQGICSISRWRRHLGGDDPVCRCLGEHQGGSCLQHASRAAR